MPDLEQLVKEFNDNKARIDELQKRNAEIADQLQEAVKAITIPTGPVPRKATHQHRGISRDVLEIMTDGKMRGVSTIGLMLGGKPDKTVRDSCRYLAHQGKLVECEPGIFQYTGAALRVVELPTLPEIEPVEDAKQAVNLGTLSFRDPLLGGA